MLMFIILILFVILFLIISWGLHSSINEWNQHSHEIQAIKLKSRQVHRIMNTVMYMGLHETGSILITSEEMKK